MINAGVAATLLSNSGGHSIAAAANLARTSVIGQNKPMDAAQIDAVAKDFEALFISQMLEQMFGDSIGSDLFGDEDTAEIYKGMMVDQYGQQIANTGGIGIADYVKKHLLELQEVPHGQ